MRSATSTSASRISSAARREAIRERLSGVRADLRRRVRRARRRLRPRRVPRAAARARRQRARVSTRTRRWCRSAATTGCEADAADAVAFLRAQPAQSLGGLFAAQVVEHLEPSYLAALLDAAFDALRPGAPIVLETINPACWFAFFESYIRDITHVRPLHPDTLEVPAVATGFQRLEIRYRAPYPEHEKLQPIAPNAALADSVETLNANVAKINRLLFTCLDYAAIGYRP